MSYFMWFDFINIFAKLQNLYTDKCHDYLLVEDHRWKQEFLH